MTLDVRENGPALAASLALAAGVKVAYSHLGPDDLRFLTGPTQALVGLMSGIDFTYEGGYGYVSLARHLVIAKSCTGANYLLAAFGLLTFTVVPAIAGPRAKLVLVAALAACAYAATVVVNAVRIALGIVLHDGGFAWGWMDAGRVHRLAGIVVYFLSLVALHALGRFALRRGGPSVSPLVVAPLVSYGLVALAVPLVNGALAARPLLFAEHCGWVVAVSATLAALLTLPPRNALGSSGGLHEQDPEVDRVGRRPSRHGLRGRVLAAARAHRGAAG